MKNIVKDALILFIITLVAGLLLGFVYEITKEPREEQAVIKKNNAYKSVFADYYGDREEYKDMDLDNLQFVDYDITSLSGLKEALESAGYTDKVVIVDSAVAAELDGKLLGYAITVTAREGYGGDIQFTVGFTLDGTVTGISFLSISETAGLGMEAKEKSFTDRYVGKSGGSFVVDKDNTAGLGNEIDAISGATITTRAVTKGVNAAYITVMEIVNGGDINE